MVVVPGPSAGQTSPAAAGSSKSDLWEIHGQRTGRCDFSNQDFSGCGCAAIDWRRRDLLRAAAWSGRATMVPPSWRLAVRASETGGGRRDVPLVGEGRLQM